MVTTSQLDKQSRRNRLAEILLITPREAGAILQRNAEIGGLLDAPDVARLADLLSIKQIADKSEPAERRLLNAVEGLIREFGKHYPPEEHWQPPIVSTEDLAESVRQVE